MSNYATREEAIAYLKWYFEEDDGMADPRAVEAFRWITAPAEHIIAHDGKHCGRCRARIGHDYKYCPYCGLPVG